MLMRRFEGGLFGLFLFLFLFSFRSLSALSFFLFFHLSVHSGITEGRFQA